MNHLYTDTSDTQPNPQDPVEMARELIATTVHDLRTPLAVIVNYCSLGEFLPEPPESAKLNPKAILNKIHTSADRISAIINSSLASFDKENLKERVNFSVADFCNDLVSPLMTYEFLAVKKNLDFTVKWDESVPKKVVLDPILTIRVIGNLIENAIKFTSAGHVKVTISFDAEVEYLIINVIDSGCGFSVGQQEELSGLVARGAEIAAPGHGIGLYNANRLARLMDGDVTLVETSEARGSHFKVKIKALPFESERSQ